MYGFFILLLFSQQSDAAFLCSEQTMTYKDAINSCFLQNGSPVDIFTTIKDQLENGLSVWSNLYASTSSDCKHLKKQTWCGYQYYLVQPPDPINISSEIRFGVCNGNRTFACEMYATNGTSFIYRLLWSDFNEAESCKFPDLKKWEDQAVTGYYWVPHSQKNVYLLSANHSINRTEELSNCLGYVYGIESSYYINCSSLRTMICEFADDSYTPKGYIQCNKVGYTSKTMATETTTIKTNSTKKSEPSNSPGTTVRKQYSTFDRDTTNHPDNVDIVTCEITEAIDKATPPLTHSNNEQTTPDLKDSNHDDGISDLDLYIGVSVAACVIILVAVFLICYRHRRAHTKHKQGNHQSENALGSDSDGNILATRNIVSISNRSYHSTSHQDEDQYIYIDDHDKDNDKNLTSESSTSKKGNTSDADTNDYAYSCSMDNNPHEATDGGHYDTTISKTSPSSMATNDYDVMDQTKQEDVYNTTRTVRQGNQVTDNIYNRLDTVEGGEETIYDKTLSQQRHQRSQVIDDTYNTLNN